MNASSFLVLLFCVSSILADVPVATKCPDGWKWFQRSRGGWCMKGFADTQTQAGAETKCQAEGARIAGVQNKDEVKWMGSTLESLLKSNSVRFWVGAKRTKLCVKTGITKECTAANSFYWTDKSTVGNQGFVWQVGEPNNYGGDQPCVGMASNLGLMDDLACSDKLPAYICGKVASFN